MNTAPRLITPEKRGEDVDTTLRPQTLDDFVGQAAARLYLPQRVTPAERRQRQGEGWLTVQGLEAAGDAATDARRLGCTHVWINGAAQAV